MANYGRQGHFLQSPRREDRLGRFVCGATPILMFAPVVVVDGEELDANGQLPLELAAAGAPPVKGLSGIALYEWEFVDPPGADCLTRPSDLDLVPANRPCQLVSGDYVRLRMTNVAEESFDGQSTYPARLMVPGIGIATPTVGVGTLLTPGVGTDDDGYWAETSDPDEAWLRVTGVYNDVPELDAQFLF